MSGKARIAVLVSGGGTNLQAILDAAARGEIPDGEVAMVISDRAGAYALERAQKAGVPTLEINKKACGGQVAFEQKLIDALTINRIDLIVLAGFLPIVPDFLIDAFPRRIVNLHPALLPKYGGKGMWGHHVHEAVKAAGESETGMTVHWVTPVCDGGEIIAQYRCALTPDDTVDDIAEKEHQLEMAYFPKVVEQVLNTTFPEGSDSL